MEQEPHEPREPTGLIASMSAASLGLTVAMASMSVLFIATLIGYVLTRAGNSVWRLPGMPGLPRGLLGSTLLIALVSLAFQRAAAAARGNRPEALERSLWMALAAALGFLCMQLLNWRVMMGVSAVAGARTLYVYTFYWLTGLHAAHVVGGFVPLGIVLKKARARQYSSSRHEGVTLCRRYWDYLGVVWLVLLTTMYVVT